MNYYIHPAGSTGESILVELRLNNNNPHTGLTYNTAGFYVTYCRPGSAAVPVTLVNQTVSGAWASGGFVEINSSLMPGMYRFDVPNAALAAGAEIVYVTFHGYGASATSTIAIQLSGYESEQIYTAPYKIISDQQGADGVVQVLKGSVLGVNLQLVDDDGSPITIGSDTCTVNVYNLANTLVASYSPTINFAANGEISFNLSSIVTSNAAIYNIYVTKVGTSSTVQFGPLMLEVKPL